MKTLALALALVISLALAPALASATTYTYTCTIDMDTNQSTCTMDNAGIVVNGTIVPVGTIVPTTNITAFLGNYLDDNIGNLTEYQKNLTDCKAELSGAKYNQTRLELCDIIQTSLGTCEADRSSLLSNITTIQSSCDSKLSGMVPSAQLTTCQQQLNGTTLNYVLVFIAGVGAFYFYTKQKTSEPEIKKRTADIDELY